MIYRIRIDRLPSGRERTSKWFWCFAVAKDENAVIEAITAKYGENKLGYKVGKLEVVGDESTGTVIFV